MATLQSQLAESGNLNIWDQFNAGKISEDQARSYLSGGGGSNASSGGVQNYADIAKQMYEMANQFRQPAIDTLQGQKPGIASTYQGLRTTAEAGKEPLKARYDALLNEVKAGTQKEATSEFTRRGIPISSGLVGQTVESRLAPQIQNIGAEKLTGLQNIDELIANLGVQEQGQYDSLAQAIAAIQAAGSGEAISSATNIYGQQQQAAQEAARLALAQLTQQQNQSLAQQQLDQPQYQTVGAGQNLIDPATGKVIYSGPYKPSNDDSLSDNEILEKIFGKGLTSNADNTITTDRGVTYPSSWSKNG